MKWTAILISVSLITGCAGSNVYRYHDTAFDLEIAPGAATKQYDFDRGLEDKLLKLNPERISGKDVEEVLSHFPAPRVLSIGGGIYTAHILLVNFSKFLIGMGYPEEKIRNPLNGDYSYSAYSDDFKIAAQAAWYYEHEGVPVILIGHSLGGMEVVKILHILNGTFGNGDIRVWNPIENKLEERTTIMDPYSGRRIPVNGLKDAVGYVAAIDPGGISRIFPNGWSMSLSGLLKKVPDSTRYFTGYIIIGDFFGGDMFGLERANPFRPMGKASVRNVQLPSHYNHVTLINTDHLVRTKKIRDWIDNYTPNEKPSHPKHLKGRTQNILLAADIWHSVKKEWCVSAQRIVRYRRNNG